MTKKFFAILLALVLTLSLSAVAFADPVDDTDGGNTQTTPPSITVGNDTYKDITSVTITKVYKETNEGTTSPAETFTVEQVGNGRVTDGDASSAPALGTITGATFAKGAASKDGATASITIALPTYTKVGVYEYTLREVVGNTAGVTYHTGDIKLVVTVMQGADGKVRVAGVHTEGVAEEGEEKPAKSGSIENTYSAGSLSVTKNVTGNMGDKDKVFNVRVTFTAPEGKAIKEEITYTIGLLDYYIPATEKEWPNGVHTSTLSLKDGQTITLNNIPYGVTYTVEEEDYTTEGYDAPVYDFGDKDKTIDSASDTVTVTNNKNGKVDTGITMDSMPYIVLLALAVVGLAAVTMKKRYEA